MTSIDPQVPRICRARAERYAHVFAEAFLSRLPFEIDQFEREWIEAATGETGPECETPPA